MPPPGHGRLRGRASSVQAAAKEVLVLGGIVDSEGNAFDAVGSTQGQRRPFLRDVRDDVKDKFGAVTGAGALDASARKDLEQRNPGLMIFLRSTSGVILEFAIFILYVALDMGKGLYNSIVMHGSFRDDHVIIVSSLIMTQGLVQLAMGLATVAALEGREGFGRLLNPGRFKRFFFVSLLFAIAQHFSTLAYTEFLPGTIKILAQCRLFNTAVLSTFVFNRRYAETQWAIMILIIMGAVIHLLANKRNEELYVFEEDLRDEHVARRACREELAHLGPGFVINRTRNALQPMVQTCVITPHEPEADVESFLLGLLYVFAYIMCSDIASIVSEMFLKQEKQTPFYIQKVTMESMGVPVLFITSFCMPWVQKIGGVHESRWAPQMWWASRDGFMGGFLGAHEALSWCEDPTSRVPRAGSLDACGRLAGGLYRDWLDGPEPWGALFFSSSQSWFAGLLVKLMSSVMKLLAKIVSLAGVFFLGDCLLLRRPGDPPVSLGAAVSAVQVMLLTYSFLTFKNSMAERSPRPVLKKTAPPTVVELQPRRSAAEAELWDSRELNFSARQLQQLSGSLAPAPALPGTASEPPRAWGTARSETAETELRVSREGAALQPVPAPAPASPPATPAPTPVPPPVADVVAPVLVATPEPAPAPALEVATSADGVVSSSSSDSQAVPQAAPTAAEAGSAAGSAPEPPPAGAPLFSGAPEEAAEEPPATNIQPIITFSITEPDSIERRVVSFTEPEAPDGGRRPTLRRESSSPSSPSPSSSFRRSRGASSSFLALGVPGGSFAGLPDTSDPSLPDSSPRRPRFDSMTARKVKLKDFDATMTQQRADVDDKAMKFSNMNSDGAKKDDARR